MGEDSWSRMDFLSKGLTTECFSSSRNVPDDSDSFTMLAMVGSGTKRHCLRNYVGTGSKSEYLSREER